MCQQISNQIEYLDIITAKEDEAEVEEQPFKVASAEPAAASDEQGTAN